MIVLSLKEKFLKIINLQRDRILATQFLKIVTILSHTLELSVSPLF